MSDFFKYKNYYATVYFNNSDEVFFGKLEGINDLVNFEGKSVTTLKRAFREAVNDYIETCKQIGKDPEKAYKGSFNVRVASKLHKEAAIVASQKNISLNQFVQAAISYAVQHDDEVIGG